MVFQYKPSVDFSTCTIDGSIQKFTLHSRAAGDGKEVLTLPGHPPERPGALRHAAAEGRGVAASKAAMMLGSLFAHGHPRRIAAGAGAERLSSADIRGEH